MAIVSRTCDNKEHPTGRTAYYVIAASDTPAHIKAQADYVCDGVADDVQINAAIAASPSTNSIIQLVGNIFNLAATITMSKNGMTLCGEGQNATILRLANGVNASIITITEGVVYPVIHDLNFEGNKANQTAGDGITSGGVGAYFYRLNFSNCYRDSIHQAGTAGNPASCRIEYVNAALSGMYNLYLNNYADDSWITNSIFGKAVASNVYIASSDVWFIHNNVYSAGWNGVAEVGDNPNIILYNTKNHIINNFINDAATDGIRADNISDTTISENIFWNNSKVGINQGRSDITIGTGTGDSLRLIANNNHFIATNESYYFQVAESAGNHASGSFVGNAINGVAAWGESGIDISSVANKGSFIIKDTIGLIRPGEVRTASGYLVPTGTCTLTTVTGTFTESPAALKPGINTLHCTADGTANVVMPAGSTAVVASVGGGATVADSPKSCPSGATTLITVTAGGTNEFTVTVTCTAAAVACPEVQNCLVDYVLIDVATPGGTATSVLQVGMANDAVGTGLGSEVFTGLDLNTAAVNDSRVAGDTGAMTKPIPWNATGADSYMIFKINTEIADALVGTYTIVYHGR